MAWNGIEVIDFHVHLPVPWPRGRARRPGSLLGSLSALPAGSGAGSRPAGAQQLMAQYGAERRRQWRRDWNFAAPEEMTGADPEVQAGRWAAELDRHGLRAALLVSGGGNDTLARVVRNHPGRLYGMAHHNLAAPDAGPEMRRAAEELGLVGLKVIGPALEVRLDDPALEAMWDYIESRGLPVLIHFGWLGTGGGVAVHPNMDPLVIHEVASRHPGIPFIVPHFGCGYWQQALQLAWNCPNIYVDTSGSNQWVRWVPYPLSLEDLFRRAYETVGPGRIIFGTDSSWFPRGFSHRYLEEQVRVARSLGLQEADLAGIFGGNAARLLGLRD